MRLQMQYSARRGFYLVIQPSDDPQPSASSRSSGATAGGLPHGFLKLDIGRARSSGIPCTTHELTALNGRLRSAADDCLVLTEQVAVTHGSTCGAHCHLHVIAKYVKLQ